MSPFPFPPSVPNRIPPAVPIRKTQLVLVALMLGVLVFTAVVATMRLGGKLPMRTNPDALRVLPWVVVAMYAGMAVAYVAVRAQLLARLEGAKEDAVELLRQGNMPAPLHALAVVGATMAEAPALLGVVTLLLGGPWYVIAAPIVSVLLIAATIPTRDRLDTLVRERST